MISGEGVTKSRLGHLLILSGFALGLTMSYNSCGIYHTEPTHGSSTLGNPMTSFAVGKYQEIYQLTMCISQMVLSTVSGESLTVPFSPAKNLSVPMSGIDMGSLAIPSGQFTKITLQLADVCGSGESLTLTNEQGTFKSNSPISLKFSGNEFVGGVPQKIVFDIQSLAADLSMVQSDAGVATDATNSLGNYHSLNCGMQTNTNGVAFCETFDQAYPVVSRSGQLNSTIWSASRSGPSNVGQGQFDIWSTSTIDACGTSQSAQPDGSDIFICNGQLRESTNDVGNVTALTLSPRQPFDFNARTGTVTFDVTNDTSGSSGVWPEFWLADQSLPGLQLFNGINSIPKNGVAIRFNGNFLPTQGALAPGCPADGNYRWVVGSISLIQNYVSRDMIWSDNNIQFKTLGCVIASDGSNGKMNHIELRISQNQIEVWATDAGSPILKEIALLQSLSLPFTRGYISLGDSHNSAAKSANPATANHTFAWDNVAFDGPIVTRDLGFDVLDSLTSNGGGLLNLGWQSQPGTPASLSTIALSASDIAAANASGASPMLTFNFYVPSSAISTLNYSINGTALTGSVPYQTATNSSYSLQLPVPVSALVPGPQKISISAGDIFILYNVSITLPGAGQ
jgi:hypothetical protein